MSAKISQEILSGAGFKNLAAEAPADELDKEGIAKVQMNAKQEIDALKVALQANGANTVLNEHFKDQGARKALLDLIAEVEGTPQVAAPAATVPAQAAAPVNWPSQVILTAWASATAAMERKLWKLNDKDWKNFLWAWQRVWSKVPGTEPTDMDDIWQAINQSRSFNEKLVAALVFEYNENTTTLPVGWFSNMPGWFPALQKNHNFGTTPYNGKTWVEWKRAYILDTMNALTSKWEQASTTNPEWLVSTVENIATWALPLFGYPALLLFAGKVGYNVLHDGIKKPWIGEAAWWSAGKVWDGTRWVATLGKATITKWYKSASGKFETKVEAKDLKDTPAYTMDEWAKERARLEETTRRMIYMDSGVNPRHNPNATAAEIFRDVEATPALKTAYDARMVKLTELGNTLVGQEKYLSKDAFNKEAGKIVAWDIKEGSIKGSILKRVPFTAERSDYKKTQEALKKVKGEIDSMRARLSAKATMDGVDIPKVLEDQFRAFEHAYNAAYEADLSLDKSRNQIARAGERINAINEVIAHFQEIADTEAKITEIKAKITEVEGRIAAQRDGAHTESAVDTRARELQGVDGEITAAKEALENARAAETKLDSDIKEAKKDVRQALERIEARETELKQNIKASNDSMAASNTEEVTKRREWQAELDNRTGELKKRDEAKANAEEKVSNLDDIKPAATQKINDATTEYQAKVWERRVILWRAVWVDAKSLTTTDHVELAGLKANKAELEAKIKEIKVKIDAIAIKPENRGFPRSTWGTIGTAQAELARLEWIVAPGGTLDAAKNTAKTARNTAFTHLNRSIQNLNTESARLNSGLEIKAPHIWEFVKWQWFSDDISLREHGSTGDKAADQKLKGSRPKLIQTVMKRGH
jgi:hypothetical protein